MNLKTITVLLATLSTITANRLIISSLLNKRDTSDTLYTDLEGIDEKCIQDYSQYAICFSDFIRDNYEEKCSETTQIKCNKFFKNPLSFLPNCSNTPEIEEYINPEILPFASSLYNLSCQKDEAGNICPVSELGMEINDNPYGSLSPQANSRFLDDICKSKSCKEATIDAYSKLLELQDKPDIINELESYSAEANKKILQYLNSNECKAMTNGVEPHFKNILLIPLSLLLLLLLF